MNQEPVVRTNIPAHLQQMLEILLLEEQDMVAEFGNASNQTGPCMEYLLHENILETLVTFGRGDTPPGMKQQVLAFATKLLGKIKQPLLPHVNVHKPVIQLGKRDYLTFYNHNIVDSFFNKKIT